MYKILLVITLILISACEQTGEIWQGCPDLELYTSVDPKAASQWSAWCPGKKPPTVYLEGCTADYVYAALHQWGQVLNVVTDKHCRFYDLEDSGSICIHVGVPPKGNVGAADTQVKGDEIIRSMIVISECRVYLIAHELGHAFGFGHSEYATDIMYPIDGVNGKVDSVEVKAVAETGW